MWERAGDVFRPVRDMEEKGDRRKKEFERIQIPIPVRIVLGGLAYGIIKEKSLEALLDEETHQEFLNNISILNEFVGWFKTPEIQILKSRDHVTVLRYLLSVYMRAYHRNVKHQILLKLSHTGRVKVISQ